MLLVEIGSSDGVGVERLVLHVGAVRCADSAVDDYVRNMNALRHQLAG